MNRCPYRHTYVINAHCKVDTTKATTLSRVKTFNHLQYKLWCIFVEPPSKISRVRWVQFGKPFVEPITWKNFGESNNRQFFELLLLKREMQKFFCRPSRPSSTLLKFKTRKKWEYFLTLFILMQKVKQCSFRGLNKNDTFAADKHIPSWLMTF